MSPTIFVEALDREPFQFVEFSDQDFRAMQVTELILSAYRVAEFVKLQEVFIDEFIQFLRFQTVDYGRYCHLEEYVPFGLGVAQNDHIFVFGF